MTRARQRGRECWGWGRVTFTGYTARPVNGVTPQTPLPRGAAARLAPLLALLALALAWPLAAAQPRQVASHGFGRPALVAESGAIPHLAIAAEDETTYVYWTDASGVWRRAFAPAGAGGPERVVEQRGVRGVYATTVDGDPAIGLVLYDMGTGRVRHVLRWRGEERLLLEDLQPHPLALAPAPDGPAALVAHRERGVSTLHLHRWGGETTAVRESSLSLDRYSLAVTEDGSALATWLEGFTDRTAIGGALSEWTAYTATVPPGGPPGEADALGKAVNRGIRDLTATGIDGGSPWWVWPSEEEALAIRSRGTTVALGPGYPLGVFGGAVFWAEGTDLFRRPLQGGGPTSQGDGASETEAVLWSPVAVERAAGATVGGNTYLAWYGTQTGGGFVLYAADDTAPLEVGWRDRLAGVLGVSPWTLWEDLIAQLIGGLFAGFAMAVLFTPLLWVGSLVLSRTAALQRRAVLSGAGLAAALLLALESFAAARLALPAAERHALFGSPALIAIALVTGALVVWLTRRRLDNESQIGVLASGWLFAFASAAVLGVFTFRAWVDAIGALG